MTAVAETHAEAPRRPRPSRAWAVIAGQELRDLWLGTRGLTALLGYSLLLSLLTFVTAGNAELNLLDARETVDLVVRVALGLGTLTALLMSADAISGERERRTLEWLLLTPVRPRHIVAGKLIAALTMWFAALLVAVPYIAVLARGPGVTAEAVLVAAVAGTLVAVTLSALGLAISVVSPNNRTSIVTSLVLLLLLAAPAQLPVSSWRGVFGDILIRANPVSAALRLSGRLIVDHHTWAGEWTLLVSPAAAAVLMLFLLFVVARRLRLEGLG